MEIAYTFFEHWLVWHESYRGIMGTILKEGYQEFCVYCSLEKFDNSLHFYFYENKQNKCVHVLYCGIVAIKEDC